MINIKIDPYSKETLYEQIINAFILAAISGEIKDGELLPSTRQLAAELDTSVITVKRAYQELQSLGLIYTIQGKGTYVKYSNKEDLIMNTLANTEDFALSFSDSENDDISEKISAMFSDSESNELKAFAANVLIGNIPAKKASENVGKEFELCGYYIKEARFKSEKTGKYIVMFGKDSDGCCGYATTSDKIYNAIMCILNVYGSPSKWQNGINVKITMHTINENGGKAYSLEVIR